jgi:hypothetical protein
MFLRDRETGDLLRVVDLDELFDPFRETVWARDQAGEEEQDPASYAKEQLVFPSGEPLPRCWCAPCAHEDTGTAELAGLGSWGTA